MFLKILIEEAIVINKRREKNYFRNEKGGTIKGYLSLYHKIYIEFYIHNHIYFLFLKLLSEESIVPR